MGSRCSGRSGKAGLRKNCHSYSTVHLMLKKKIGSWPMHSKSRFIIKPVEPRELVKEITQALLDISSGKLKISDHAPIKEEEYLEQYSRRIFKKLEEKVAELEKEIEERKRIKEELRKSSAQFKVTFEEAPIGMARMDTNGQILETNHIL